MAMLPQTLSLERGCIGDRCLRDPSFSSYLSDTEDCYVINLFKNSFTHGGDKEIDVFSAERYFNETLEDEERKVIVPPPPVQDLVLGSHTKVPSGASSVRSMSSWNSQGALLYPELRYPFLKSASSVKSRSYLRSFRCVCMCSDKNSVAVYQNCTEASHLTHSPAKESVKRCISSITAETQCMTNPAGPKRETCLSSKELSIEHLAMKPRKSLEDCLSGPYAQSDSDSSSDLFDLEVFSSKENTFVCSNNMSDSTMSTVYAPSEASIEWSIVTASTADFPITSDINKLRPHTSCSKTNSNTFSKDINKKRTATSNKSSWLSSSILDCNSQSSVEVVTNENKAVTKTSRSKHLPVQNPAKLRGAEAAAHNMQIGYSSRSKLKAKLLRHQPLLIPTKHA